MVSKFDMLGRQLEGEVAGSWLDLIYLCTDRQPITRST